MSTETSTNAAAGLKRARVLGLGVGRYGIAGFAALLSGTVLYYVFRALYGGPRTPSAEAGDDAIALAEAEVGEAA